LLLVVDVRQVLKCPEGGTVPYWRGNEPNRVDLDWLVKNEGCSGPEAFRKAGSMKKSSGVRVVGLTSRPDLNGKRGVVKSLNFDTLRYRVELAEDGKGGGVDNGSSGDGGGGGSSGNTFNMKHSNLHLEENFHEYNCDAPLVLVRYLHRSLPPLDANQSKQVGTGIGMQERLFPFDSRSASFRDGSWLSSECVQAGDNHGFRPIHAESVENVLAGLAELPKHEALLSKE
jgi:hypothetical protein